MITKHQLFPSISESRLHVLSLLYLIVFSITHAGLFLPLRVAVCSLAIVALVFPAVRTRPVYWLVHGALFLLGLFFTYSYSSNHYYLAMYLSFYLALIMWDKPARGTDFNFCRYLLVVVFVFATLHKVASPYFMSGRMLADYVLSESSLNPGVGWLFEDLEEEKRVYQQAKEDINYQLVLSSISESRLSPLPATIAYRMRAFSMAILVVEALVVLLLLWNRSFRHPDFPLLILAFVWGTYLFRNEYSFFALICILALFASKPENHRNTWALIVTALIFLGFEIGRFAERLA